MNPKDFEYEIKALQNETVSLSAYNLKRYKFKIAINYF